MPLTCRMCKRINPVEAVFCHYDGVALDGQPQAGPVPAGQRTFPNPFVFPSGRSCRNFDELVLGCEANWPEAGSVLKQGFFEGFFRGLGRADLAVLARQAAQAPDLDRALDDFVGKLPSSARKPRRLDVRPGSLPLGNLDRSRDHRVNLDLANLGNGLVVGDISADCDWLMIGDGAGIAQKVIQFHDSTRVPVRVIGKNLRAGPKPLEGRLTVATNGGTNVVLVTVDVPVKPFPTGVLAGATTPRDLAQKAKLKIKEAAPCFERGEVEQWYRDNGWIYPVVGPASSGIAAIQQFFEALGLVVAPKVTISMTSVTLRGAPGETLFDEIEVRSDEKKPVYAHGAASVGWLSVDRAILKGQTARVPIRVPRVPDDPGERLLGRIEVVANGGQRFGVEVTLHVTGKRKSVAIPTMPVVQLVEEDIPVVEPEPVDVVTLVEPEPLPVLPARPQEVRQTRPYDPFAEMDRQEPDGDRPERKPMGWHLLPLGLLLVCLMGAGVRDLFVGATTPPPLEFTGGPGTEEPLDPKPYVGLAFHDREVSVTLGTTGVKPVGGGPDANRRAAFWDPSMRFGLVVLGTRDIKRGGNQVKRLNFEPDGTTNNAVVRLDGGEYIFGERPWRLAQPGAGIVSTGSEILGDWVADQRDVKIPDSEKSISGRRSVWVYPSKVEVTQTVEIVRGSQSNKFDTVLVRYSLHNKDSVQHSLGIRFLLDTYIGSNDGVPFLIPGATKLCSTQDEFIGTRVPDFLQALENEDLASPGTIAQVGFRVNNRIEAPNRVTLGAWPNVELRDAQRRTRQEKTKWEVPMYDIRTLTPGDSAVTIYWDEKPVGPGQKREVGFTYGLGGVSGGEGGGKLALTVGGSFVPRGEFTLTAYVSNPVPNQTVTVQLPSGFALVEGAEQQTVPAIPPGATSRNSPVTWKIRAGAEGTFPLKVRSSLGAEQSQSVKIRARGIFGE